MVDEYKIIEHRRKEWIGAVNACDVERYLELLTEDVLWFPPGQPAFQGKDAFESWISRFFERFRYRFSINRPKLQLSGFWALERAAYNTKMRSVANGKRMEHSGKYLLVWRKDQDGIWRIDCYIGEA